MVVKDLSKRPATGEVAHMHGHRLLSYGTNGNEDLIGLTRLMKMMRASGTPCSMSTSTAFMADPPVAVCM